MTALSYELAFWNDCLDTLEEENKQRVYARLMGIEGSLRGRSVVDIGGGPVSMLLKCRDRGECAVVDPLIGDFPIWVRGRYREAGIAPINVYGEDLELGNTYDEAWIYNVLQHVKDPELVIKRARASAGLLRIFEWINIPAYEGHPHELYATDLDKWCGGKGMVLQLNETGCVGTAYVGVFGEA